MFNGWMPEIAGPLEELGQWMFFQEIFDFLDNEILALGEQMLYRMSAFVASIALVLMTLWILLQGFRIVTGQSRESMMALIANSARGAFIVIAASTLTIGGADIYEMLTDSMPKAIHYMVTGKDEAPAKTIDQGLTQMQAAMAAIEALPLLDNPSIKEDKDQALVLTGLGVAGPAVIGGALLMMYKVALALFVGMAPLFILSLMFEQTKQLFGRWLYYGIGTMFSMAVLSFMVTVSMKMVGAVAGGFAVQYLAASGLSAAGIEASTPGISTMAMQQGGLGMVLTVLLITIPPLAASFFQGALGNFGAYSAFGAVGRGADGSGQQAGSRPGAGANSYPRPLERSKDETEMKTRSIPQLTNPGLSAPSDTIASRNQGGGQERQTQTRTESKYLEDK
ncbi:MULTISPECIES: type IV secretion system protein [Lysobacter]|uniref:type IV secretion system protein n=1 Tax=Lysobacter TaxID=68 RepID=UPI001F1A455C|nr:MULTISPECIES: type IV secretion system protein [Lysobacter]UJB17448.1 type IV secretion system protein [Lysobacter capsici]UJQ28829.1 type IV secretion system protein [Lysobacter gummosus]